MYMEIKKNDLTFTDIYFFEEKQIKIILENFSEDELFHAFLVTPDEIIQKVKKHVGNNVIQRIKSHRLSPFVVDIDLVFSAQNKILKSMRSIL